MCSMQEQVQKCPRHAQQDCMNGAPIVGMAAASQAESACIVRDKWCPEGIEPTKEAKFRVSGDLTKAVHRDHS